jgi:hypothetical protein
MNSFSPRKWIWVLVLKMLLKISRHPEIPATVLTMHHLNSSLQPGVFQFDVGHRRRLVGGDDPKRGVIQPCPVHVPSDH